jgi:hypothetical protein
VQNSVVFSDATDLPVIFDHFCGGSDHNLVIIPLPIRCTRVLGILESGVFY